MGMGRTEENALTVSIEDLNDDRVFLMWGLTEEGKPIQPYYQRYIGEETECWFFGCGLGEQTMFIQQGTSFLEMVDEGNDPKLGRIMFSMGHGLMAFQPYKGDHNVIWAWAMRPNQIDPYLKEMDCRPDLFLSRQKEINAIIETRGIKTSLISAGVNPKHFFPMNKPREGIGFCGIDSKGEEQKRIVIEPARAYSFEWLNKTRDDFRSVRELNEWYNTKQIALGMLGKTRQVCSYIPTRVFETLSSETPLIIFKLYEFEENMGFDYPYQTTSAKQTKYWIDYILDDYDSVQKEIGKYAKIIREKYNYKNTLSVIFEALEDKK